MLDQIQNITQSAEFKNIPQSSELYLSSIFIEDDKPEMHFGFYSTSEKKIYSFVTHPEIYIHTVSPPVQHTDPPKIKIDDQVLMHSVVSVKFKQLLSEKYNGSKTVKIFYLLQEFNEKLVWQCVALTDKLVSISVRMDAKNANVVDESTGTLMGLT